MKYISLYEFTPAGMHVFERVFTDELDDTFVDLADPSLVDRLSGTGPLDVTEFATAKDLALAVINSFNSKNLYEYLPNEGLWAWLTFVLRDQLFTRDADGRRNVGEIHRWYPSKPNDWRKAQRHLVRMPVLLLASLGRNADHLLCGPPSVLPEIREQLTSQQDMFSESFQRVARELYFDDTTGKLKRGAGSKTGGTPRRLAQVRKQLDVTWELDILDFDRVMSILPKEFERFKTGSAL